MNKGLIICNIGSGKGKTTAAMGTVIRASGAGLKVFIIQFVKAKGVARRDPANGIWPLSAEIEFLNKVQIPPSMGAITSIQVGAGFVGILGDKQPLGVHIQAAEHGLEITKQIFNSKLYDVVVLDEIISAIELKLFSEQDVVGLLQIKPERMHVIMTGHNVFPKIVEMCDLVTDMRVRKHPYYKGVLAQRGIDY